MKKLFFLLLLMTETLLAQKLSQERILFSTNYGDVVVALYPEVAPKHTDQFLKLVRLGVFDGAAIHRLEPGFFAQVDNYDRRVPPLSPEQLSAIHKIPAEFSSLIHRRGLLSMARFDNDVNSAESSFSFMLGAAPHLDGKYTIFGEITAGMDVLDAIGKIHSDPQGVPEAIVRISQARLVGSQDLPLNLQPRIAMDSPSGLDEKTIFEIVAGLAFFFTVGTAVARNFFPKLPL